MEHEEMVLEMRKMRVRRQKRDGRLKELRKMRMKMDRLQEGDNAKDVTISLADYLDGKYSDLEELEWFGMLIRTGKRWDVPGHITREIRGMIDSGWISESGELNWKKIEANGIE